jgi:hypothetical protein
MRAVNVQLERPEEDVYQNTDSLHVIFQCSESNTVVQVQVCITFCHISLQCTLRCAMTNWGWLIDDLLTAFLFDICMYQQSHCTMIELLLACSLTGQNIYSCLGCKQNVGSERFCSERSLQFRPSKSSLPPDFFPTAYLVVIPIWHDKPQQLYQPTAMAIPWGTLACTYVLNTLVINPQADEIPK